MSLRGRFLFADQLGPHFDDGLPIVLVESRAALGGRPLHRQKAHLLLSAMRHRAAESPGTVTLIKADTFADALRDIPTQDMDAVAATSRNGRAIIDRHGFREIHPERGWLTSPREFREWVRSRSNKRFLMEDWYRHTRKRHGILMTDGKPVGGKWNFDSENRQPPPRGASRLPLPDPWQPTEDSIDSEVRAELNRWEEAGATFVGVDGPRRFAVTRSEALAALEDFVKHRLSTYGKYQDAVLANDVFMSHSLLSVPMNLGLLHPLEVVDAVVEAFDQGHIPVSSAEGFVRQVIGWREYVWHLYWHLGPEYEEVNALAATTPMPSWLSRMEWENVTAACLKGSLKTIAETGYAHHIVRLMILSNWATQRGYSPAAVLEWFRRGFVDGYPWVMVANVLGMGLYADGGTMATKPYISGGAYLSRMTDFCSTCVYDPRKRVGEYACPFTNGYWAFLQRNRSSFEGNHRMATALRTLDKLADLDDVVDAFEANSERIP